MGMYTGLRLDLKLKKETEKEWRPVIEFMLNNRPDECEGRIKELLKDFNHALLESDRFAWMLNMGGAYLDGDFEPNSSLNDNHLLVSFNIKNYDREIQKFLDFLSPHVEKLIEGKYQYEEFGMQEVEFIDGRLEINPEVPSKYGDDW